jgi:integrase
VIIVLSKSASLKVRHLAKRGNHFQFCMRVPKDLRERYGTEFIRKSLKTTDERQAARDAERMTRSFEAAFAALRGNKTLTPAETHRAAQALADELGPWDIAIDYFSEKFDRHADKLGLFGHPLAAEMIKDKDFLSPIEIKAQEILRSGSSAAPRLSAALSIYVATHQNADDAKAMERAERDWGRLISLAGDIAIANLSREHARAYVIEALGRGLKTTSVRRETSTLSAILNVGMRELDIHGVNNPFSSIPIPNEGKDAKDVKTPSVHELKAILAKFGSDDSDFGLIIRMQMGLGTRIAEVSGLTVADVVLEGETPHVHFHDHPWRTLKNDCGERRVPLVGFALDAARIAVARAGKNTALFVRYAKKNGNTNASATINKRLKPWAIGTHGFRHGMKDLLREAGCPDVIQKEIQGHAGEGHAANYGQGYSLKVKQDWLTKAIAQIHAAQAPNAPSTDVS